MQATTRRSPLPAASAAPDAAPHWRELTEVLAALVVMFFTALGVAVALAGAVLLLAAPAHAAEGAAPPTAEPRHGALLLRDALGNPQPVPVLATEVRIQVSGPLAHTRVVQTFRNPSDAWLEGIYVFPLPDSAAVSSMRLRIGERVIDSEVQERSRARAEYQRARDDGRRAALVEQERPNIFTTSVANIGPRQQVVVELEYRQQLDYRLENGRGRFSLRFPMVVGPRYIPGRGTGESDPADPARISPPVAHPSEELVNPVDLRIRLDAGMPIERVHSPYHSINVLPVDDNRRLVVLADGATPADRDFELDWTLLAGSEPAAALFTESGPGGRSHALLMLMPPGAPSGTELLPRDLVFVIDTSGSMEGDSIVQAREAVASALGRLQPADRFNVIEFNSQARAMFAGAEPASAGNIGFARQWIARLRAQGGTEMAAALRLALAGGADDSRVRQVVFLTDGAVGNEAELFRLIQQQLGDSRLFTVGIGSAPNSHFMRKAAQFGRGSFTYIGRIEEVKERMSALFERLEAPVARNVRVEWPAGAAADALPARVPDLYLGEPLVVAAELQDGAGEVVVSGEAGGQPWSRRIPLASASLGSGVGSLWARRKIDALMDRLASGEDENLVRAEVIPLAIDYRLASRYTSFVAVDHSPARPEGSALGGGHLPTQLPHGWNYAAVFGELPRGASDARWHLVLGAIALLLAVPAALLGRRRGSPV